MTWTKIDKELKIQDNVLGFIELNEEEANLIQHPLFQRLKNIKQLGFNYYVFPGATHTRFAHSLGVFGLLKKMLYALKNLKDTPVNSVLLDHEKELKFAALLHDIGHYPFSHVMESFFNKKHEKNTKDILKSSVINEYLNDLGCDTETIYNIITGEYVPSQQDDIFLRQMLNSDLDADRLDYLIRDGLHTGVPFGGIDLDNIIRLAVIEDGELCFNKKAIRSIDHYLNARVSMYDTVYTHKTSIAFEVMFNRICGKLNDEHTIPFQDIVRPDTVDEEEFFHFDDNFLLTKIHEVYRAYKVKGSLDDSQQKYLALITDFLSRVPYKLVFEASSFLARDNANKIRDPEQSKQVAQKIENFKIELDKWLQDDPEREEVVLYKEGKPILFSKGFPQLHQDESDEGREKDKWKYESIKIIDMKTHQKDFIHDVTNSIVFFLSGYALRSIKVFSKNRVYLEEINDLWKKTTSSNE